jgi:hypothetical protein
MVYAENPWNTLLGALSLLDSVEKMEGRVRLQKMVYLLKCNGEPLFEDAQFRYRHFGPFSDDLASQVERAVEAGFIEEKVDKWGDGPYEVAYKYGLTPNGKIYRQGSHGLRPESVTLASDLMDEHWRTLELGATAAFLYEQREVPSESAIERAIELKLKCAPYRKRAEEIFRRVCRLAK